MSEKKSSSKEMEEKFRSAIDSLGELSNLKKKSIVSGDVALSRTDGALIRNGNLLYELDTISKNLISIKPVKQKGLNEFRSYYAARFPDDFLTSQDYYVDPNDLLKKLPILGDKSSKIQIKIRAADSTREDDDVRKYLDVNAIKSGSIVGAKANLATPNKLGISYQSFKDFIRLRAIGAEECEKNLTKLMKERRIEKEKYSNDLDYNQGGGPWRLSKFITLAEDVSNGLNAPSYKIPSITMEMPLGNVRNVKMTSIPPSFELGCTYSIHGNFEDHENYISVDYEHNTRNDDGLQVVFPGAYLPKAIPFLETVKLL